MHSILLRLFLLLLLFTCVPQVNASDKLFEFQAIDTMKFSRDVAREKLKDITYDKEIERQIRDIANTGATHVAIATPYDDEFIPFLRRWVSIARSYKLKVWFRGNMSGWEEWFGYPRIDRNTHLSQVVTFIQNNPDLFEDGDAFTSCPECENGGPGDPRLNGDPEGHKQFLIDEYKAVKQAFESINKVVIANYYSMNGDVAELIMDKDTTAALDGVVTVDHYVGTTEELVQDIRNLAEKSGGKVMLGEFGAPIPDIHGDYTEEQQAAWVEEALSKMAEMPELIGLSYWTSKGGSTKLWNDDNTPRLVVKSVTKYFDPKTVSGTITNELGQKMSGVEVRIGEHYVITNDKGYYKIVTIGDNKILLTTDGYITISADIPEFDDKTLVSDFVMKPKNPSYIYNLIIYIMKLLGLR